MADSSMVIMWPTRNGSVTLSQRKAPYETEPKLDPNPPRIATLDHEATSLQGGKPSFAFTMPYDSEEETQDIIWAYSRFRPESARTNGHISIHHQVGSTSLKILRTDAGPVAQGETDTAVEESSLNGVPLLPYQKMIILHAIFCIAGFLVLLPLGSLLARYMRGVYPSSITLHWVIQGSVAGSVILIGILAGFKAVEKSNAAHFDDAHKRWGVFLVALYITQVVAGTVIHRIKPNNPTAGRLHVAFGLSVIALSFYQVHVGYTHEWTVVTGRAELKLIKPLWWSLIIAVPLLYIGGLFLGSSEKKIQHNLGKTAGEDLAMEERRPLRADEDDEMDSAQLEPHKP
ncbi:hypothetical protein OF83DRAFT_463876 [Amylostereum chailletii]|nr:hypothetical protein OF83DRAFT_463876 [Amylostereum chailletii]